MALIFMEGFEALNVDYLTSKWDVSPGVGNIYIGNNYSRDGIGNGARIFYGGYLGKGLPSAPQTVITGFAFKIEQYPSGMYEVVTFLEGMEMQDILYVQTDGSLRATRYYGAQVGLSSPGVIKVGTYCFIEVKVTISNTVGSFIVKVDGETVISATGVDTQASSNAYVTQVRFSGAGTAQYDDIYILDTTGSVNNDFIGDKKITTIFPDADGTYSDFTPSTGSDNYAVVDDNPLSTFPGDYNQSSTVGHKDTYSMGAFSAPGAVSAVQINNIVSTPDTGTMYVRNICRSGTTPADNEGASVALSQTVKGARTVHEVEPTDAVAWTAAKINAAEFGLKIHGVA